MDGVWKKRRSEILAFDLNFQQGKVRKGAIDFIGIVLCQRKESSESFMGFLTPATRQVLFITRSRAGDAV